MDAHTVTVEIPEPGVAIDDVVKALANAGYSVTKVERKGTRSP